MGTGTYTEHLKKDDGYSPKWKAPTYLKIKKKTIIDHILNNNEKLLYVCCM